MTFLDFMGFGQVRTNMAHFAAHIVPTRPNANMSIDFFTYDLYTGECKFIECFDQMTCHIVRASGTLEEMEMWVETGNKDAALTFFPIHVARWVEDGSSPFHPAQQNYIYIHEECYRVLVPHGIPYMLHHILDIPYTVESWFYQSNKPQYQRLWHSPPVDIENPYWQGPPPIKRLCLGYDECWWSSEAGGWEFGGGTMEIKPDGQYWPKGGLDCFAGASETHPQGLPPIWLVHVWSPTPWDQYAMWSE